MEETSGRVGHDTRGRPLSHTSTFSPFVVEHRASRCLAQGRGVESEGRTGGGGGGVGGCQRLACTY